MIHGMAIAGCRLELAIRESSLGNPLICSRQSAIANDTRPRLLAHHRLSAPRVHGMAIAGCRLELAIRESSLGNPLICSRQSAIANNTTPRLLAHHRLSAP